MNYQAIGLTSYNASRIAMGVMRIAGKSREEAAEIVQAAIDCGINFKTWASIVTR